MTWIGDQIAAIADCGKEEGVINFSMMRLGPSPWQESSPSPEASEESSPPPAAETSESGTPPPPIEGATVVQTKEHVVTVTDHLGLGGD